jgi:antitoxin ParD1/3/4
MNVSLTPQLQALVEGRVRSGRYQSASEVVREALRLLEDVEELRSARLKELRKDIAAGLKDRSPSTARRPRRSRRKVAGL